MARASGPAVDALVPGEFHHKPSGVRYRVYLKDEKAWMTFDRSGDSESNGKRQLLYFIGSGEKGRTYLFSEQGFLFETPINWYSQENRWNMTPAYTEAREIPMTLPATANCLTCHTSSLKSPLAGTENRYDGKPFSHDGITCERCHGPGESHAARRASIVNPAKLPPERRDAICMQCHFEGSVAIEQSGHHLYEFRPGDDLSNYIHYFILNEPESEKPRARSAFESFSMSVCKQKSGDKMSCTSCHDPHVEPSVSEKVAYYRGKCIACHGESFAEKHHADKPDCVHCHMPQLPNASVAHTESTDHRILRHPAQLQLANATNTNPKLTPFPPHVHSTDRDLAIAWQTLATQKVNGASQLGEHYVKRAISEQPTDSQLLAADAFIQQEQGHINDARELYERALKADPLSIDAATDLGVLEARSGNLVGAVHLWQGAFERAPHRSAIGMNLANAFCAAGQINDARNYVLQVLAFNPDLESAKHMLAALNRDKPSCSP
jgi:Flp pilus assembly protein TadD